MTTWNAFKRYYAAPHTPSGRSKAHPIGNLPDALHYIYILTFCRKLGGQALRQCINLGYHRSQRRLGTTVDLLQEELQKRAFWSAYVMECSAAVMLGRPLSLRFEEIDAEVRLHYALAPTPLLTSNSSLWILKNLISPRQGSVAHRELHPRSPRR